MKLTTSCTRTPLCLNKPIKTLLSYILLLFLINTTAQAQHQIKGTVRDSHTDQPVAGATVKLKGSAISTQTDEAGRFTLPTDRSEGVLEVSHLGYKAAEYAFKAIAEPFAITLEPDEGILQEVEINAGYYTVTDRERTGSISRITAEEIGKQPVTNVLSALSGRMPGVFVQTTNGLPGGNINIQIRGTGSIMAGTQPLYIIDGVPFNGAPINAGTVFSVENIAGTLSPLNNINPNDIESINVLKDADATAIYGSRGANGVVLITTKKAFGKPEFVINITQGIDQLASKPNLLDMHEYLQIRREAFSNDGKVPSSDPMSFDYAPDLTIWDTTQTTDWVDYIFGHTGRNTNMQATLTGGNETRGFLVSGNYRNEGTVMTGDAKFRRGGINSRFHHRSNNNKLTLGLANSVAVSGTQLPNPVNSISDIILLAPHYPLYNEDGTYNWYFMNIAARLHAKSFSDTYNFISHLNVKYNILPSLNVQMSGGYNKARFNQVQLFPLSSLALGSVNHTNFGQNANNTFLLEPQVNYTTQIGRVSFKGLVGGTYQNSVADRQSIVARNFSVESLMKNLASAGEIQTRTNDHTQYKYASLFTRLAFGLHERYFINGTFRRDGSSKFGPGNRFGNFASIGVAWLFSEESFMESALSFLSFGKLRASYGTTGNDKIPDYQFLSTYGSSGTTLYQGTARLTPSRIANAHFRWETTRKSEIGLELGLFQNRLSLTGNYYLNRSDDQLVRYSIPQITGFPSYQANLPAVIENKGLELDLHMQWIRKGNARWTSAFNISFPKNRLKSFENFEASSYAEQYELGYDINRIYGYKFLGVDTETGAPLYAGENGETSSAPYGFHTLGKRTPDYYGGLSNTVSFHGFQLDVFLQFAKQIGKGGILYNPGVSIYHYYTPIINRWQQPGDVTDIPKATTLWDFYYNNSSANIFNTSYVRVKNIALSYDLPKVQLDKIRLQGLKLMLQAQNIFTFWDQAAAVLDPESGASGTTAQNIPPVKSWVIGLQLTL